MYDWAFPRIVHSSKPLLIFAKSSIKNIWQGSKYVFKLHFKLHDNKKALVHLINNIFYDIMDLRLFYFHVTTWTLVSFQNCRKKWINYLHEKQEKLCSSKDSIIFNIFFTIWQNYYDTRNAYHTLLWYPILLWTQYFAFA